MLQNTANDRLQVILAQPRGFCAGVVRAIDIVELALQKYGPPIYVRHEIVHNRHVVENLIAKGAHFVEELSEVPDGAITIFSAHGVPRAVVDEARRPRPADARRDLPARLQGAQPGAALYRPRAHADPDRPCRPPGGGGHARPDRRARPTSCRTRRRSRRCRSSDDTPIAYVTQTTLSVDDTSAHDRGAEARASPTSSGRRRATSATPRRTARAPSGTSPASPT